jgi:hypothetical protein
VFEKALTEHVVSDQVTQIYSTLVPCYFSLRFTLCNGLLLVSIDDDCIPYSLALLEAENMHAVNIIEILVKQQWQEDAC